MATRELSIVGPDGRPLFAQEKAAETPTEIPAGFTAIGGLLVPASGGARRDAASVIKAFGQMPWLRAVTSKIADAVSSAADFRVLVSSASSNARSKVKSLERLGAGALQKAIKRMVKQQELQTLDDHPLLDLLTGGNEFQTGAALLKLTQIYLDLVGEAFWLLQRDEPEGPPVSLFVLSPQWVRETPSRDRPVFLVQHSGLARAIPESEIVWLREPLPSDPFGRGGGIGQVLADELDTDEFAAKFSRASMANSAMPAAIVSPKTGTMSMAEMNRFKEVWFREHEGFVNAFKPHFASQGLEVETLTPTFKDLQLTDLRKFERDSILQIYGVPPEIAGVLNPGSNRATIEGGRAIFEEWVLLPRLSFLQRSLQFRLVPEFGHDIFLEVVSPVREDRNFIREKMRDTPWAFTVDEHRRLVDAEPLPDGAGEVFQVPLALTPVSLAFQGIRIAPSVRVNRSK